MSARSFPWPTVKEDDEEDDDNKEPNENKAPADNVIHEADEHHPTTSIKIMTASEKLSNACFGMVNSCKQVNCEYSHDKAIIAVARDKQIVDLMVAKRAMQDSHQATMKVLTRLELKCSSLQLLNYGTTTCCYRCIPMHLIASTNSGSPTQRRGRSRSRVFQQDSCNDPKFSQEHPQARVSDGSNYTLCR